MTEDPDSTANAKPGTDEGLRSALPPDRFVPVRRWVLDDAPRLGGLRRDLREELNSLAGVDADRILGGIAHDLVLVASELATNAIQHGRPPTLVELFRDGADFLLTVSDHDVSSEPRVAGDRAPGLGGFGLQIARRLSRDVGWYRTDTIKVIWAEINA